MRFRRSRSGRPRLGAAIRSVVAVVILPILAPAAGAEPVPITIDGLFDDWTAVDPAYTDAAGDGGPSGIDFGRIWIADDPRFLFLRFEAGREILLNDGNNLTLYLDTDSNEATGLAVGGIGAELAWRFGFRDGTYYRLGQGWGISQSDIRLRAMPTVTAPGFEVAIGRDTEPDGSHPLFFGTGVRVLLRDAGGNGDWLPDNGEILGYEMDAGTLPPGIDLPFEKEQAEDLRVVTWNVKNDSPWNPALTPRFRRLVRAVAPEIMNFQEIYDHSPGQTAALVEDWLPSGQGEAWYAAGNVDCQTISRYPIDGSWALDGNLAVLLDATTAIGSSLLVVNAHLPCCTDDAGRQEEVDRILAFLRDAKTPGGQIDLPEGTPFLVLGDMNFVGLSQQPRSLLTGDVVDEQTYGPDFDPDWDGSSLTSLVSRQTEKRMAYTWRNDGSSYWPGHLDYVVYSDHVLTIGNHYLVYTAEMSPGNLAAHGLEGGDSEASDHLLVCADFRPPAPTALEGAVGTERDGTVPPSFLPRLDPNPSRGGGRVTLDLSRPCQIRLELFDHRGRLVAAPLGRSWLTTPAGALIRFWDGKGLDGRTLPAGSYIVRLRVQEAGREFRLSGKWVLVR